jgi:dTDP-glucose pyrophosphorylase
MTTPLPFHLIMPMGGRGSRFSEMGFMQPKPLIPLRGKPFCYWAAQSIAKFVPLKDIIFVTLKEHIEQFHIDDEIRRHYPDAIIRVLDEVLNGAVLTCLEGCNAVDDDLPVIFNDCDHLFRCNEFYQFCGDDEKRQIVDGGLLTFESHDPKFSFVRYDNNGHIIGTVEKNAVSNRAICGAYYFKNKNVFQSAVKQYLKNCRYQEYFVSGVYNELAKTGGHIVHFDVDFHVPFGTPEEYQLAEGQPYFE